VTAAAVPEPFVQLREHDAGGVRQVVYERFARPVTFNGLRSKPGPARQMAAGQWRMTRELEAWRAAAQAAGESGAVAALFGAWRVDVLHLRVNGSGMPDTAAAYVAYKGTIDGLVDAGLLPNGDGPRFVRTVTFHPPIIVGCDGLRVLFTAMPSAEQTALDFTEGTATP
jgi:hypothetical protein